MTRSPFVVAVIVALVAACGGNVAHDASSDAGDGAIDVGPARTPIVHRSAPTTCPTDRPPSPPPMFDTGGECKSDADCTAGRNGRCLVRLPWPAKCTYDECVVDADCSDHRVCTCRDTGYEFNACRAGACVTDGDCGDEYCSPSYAQCPGDGVERWVCHTRRDECVDDADCNATDPGRFCKFDDARGIWACTTRVCPV